MSQGITKAQSARGRIKKLAREQGLNQGMDSETKSPILGSKRLSSQSFPESEEKAVRKQNTPTRLGLGCKER